MSELRLVAVTVVRFDSAVWRNHGLGENAQTHVYQGAVSACAITLAHNSPVYSSQSSWVVLQ